MLSRREFLGSAVSVLGVLPFAGLAIPGSLLAFKSASEISEEVRKQSERMLKPSTKAMFDFLGLPTHLNVSFKKEGGLDRFKNAYLDLAIRFTRKEDIYICG